jgi:hypothetical protein
MTQRLALIISALLYVGCSHPANFLYEQPVFQKEVKLVDPGTIDGTIVNSVDGVPLAGVMVAVHLGSAIGPITQTVQSSTTGVYQVPNLQPGDYYLDFSLAGYVPIDAVPGTVISDQATVINESMTTILPDGEWRFIVTWCGPLNGCAEPDAVRDVDSYLLTPDMDPNQPIGFSNKTPPNVGANLDRDDTSWYGPETISITDLRQGKYIYYVNNYSERNPPQFGGLGNSQIVVHVYKGNRLLKVYNVPQGLGLTYEVCHIENGQLVNVEAYDLSNRLHVY